jgi:hypothetical protein
VQKNLWQRRRCGGGGGGGGGTQPIQLVTQVNTRWACRSRGDGEVVNSKERRGTSGEMVSQAVSKESVSRAREAGKRASVEAHSRKGVRCWCDEGGKGGGHLIRGWERRGRVERRVNGRRQRDR